MPSKSPAQKRLMQAAAHDPAFAKKAGVPVGVAQEFEAADEAKDRPKPKPVGRAMARVLRGQPP